MTCWQFWIILIRLRKYGFGVMNTPSGLRCMDLAESTQRGCSLVIDSKDDSSILCQHTTTSLRVAYRWWQLGALKIIDSF